MLLWNYFDFSKWSLEKLEDASGQKAMASPSHRQRSFLAGRLALQQLLRQQKLPLEISIHDSLGFLQIKNAFASISHTDEVSVAVLSSHPVGIDIESCSRGVSHVLTKIASASEIESLSLIDTPIKSEVKDPGLFLWTAKESFSKALGLGLRDGIKDLQIQLSGKAPFQATSSLTTPFTLSSPVISFMALRNYLVGFCFEKRLGPEPFLFQEIF